MREVNVFKEVDYDVDNLDVMKDILEFALKKENLDNITFNVIIVDNDYIHKINKEYRKIDRETDVITFALEDEDSVKVPGDVRVLGDIYISYDRVKSQALEYGHSEKRELCFLAVHGFYHLLGYDHMTKEEEKVMFGKQEEVLSSYGIVR
ncbi:MAG: rRNA maturation RNase YbeY [Bacilli bacterium]|nr:rRNA maturation RNase YbeY [Bacilli bacterium]